MFFPRANAPPPAPAPFVLADGRPFQVGYARFVPPDLRLPDRLVALARLALEEARPRSGLPLFLCLPAPCEGLSEAALDDVARRIAALASAAAIERFVGAAGAFDALTRIASYPRFQGAGLLGVDSFFHVDRAAALAARPPGPFAPARLWPAEGAGALVLARDMKTGALGTILTSKTALGRGTDDDDEPVDGAALTGLLESLSESAPIRAVFGQERVDALRSREWQWSAARQASMFHPEAFGGCLEAEIGQVGAAAGVMALAHAFASVRHGVCPPGAPILAWAISRDGTRGLALGVGAESNAMDTLRPLEERIRPRCLDLHAVSPDEHASLGDLATEADEVPFDPDAALAPANDILPLERPLPDPITEAPMVQLDRERLRPVSLPGFYAEVVAHCAEALGMLGKVRERSPRRGVPEMERRLLCHIDAIHASGRMALGHLVTSFREHLDDPWHTFGATLVAMGAGASNIVSWMIDALPEGSAEHARLVAEALSLSEHAELFALGRALHASTRPIARAIGLSFLAARGALTDEEVQRSLSDASPLVRAAALDACATRPAASQRAFIAALRSALLVEDRANAFRAARQLAILGDVEARRAFEDSAVAARLGPLLGELYVLAGRPEDARAAETFFTRQTATPALLSAAGRWGSPAVLPRLLQCLADEDLSFAAADALAVMLGPALPPEEMRDAKAWRRVIASMRLDPPARFRRGLPSSAVVVADECASGDLARGDLARRVDELRARLGRLDPVPVWGYAVDVEAGLVPLLRAARDTKGKA
ncbi:hypothetical protein [Polyangium jinanense]|uniref:Uncharacterized protein n=1 Tax=Polyangium jinanense TaxID=2829994 RepID=A0A9X3XCC6_9BACT|nr:hypothetical protein [Polyangium jinanense]MDC3961370.1 hypothetical protein [Polyangium jinanense]MDC3987749.1 hypothetical protein [Polyangium jinanense]